MFDKLTHKQKFLAMLGGFLLLALAGYKKNIRPALIAKKELAVVEQKLDDANNSVNDLYGLRSDIDILDNTIGGHTSEPTQVQRLILDFVSRQEFNVNLISMEDVHLFSDEEFLVYTNQLELEGTYENLIELLYQVEKEFKSSRVVSNSIYSKRNYRTNTTKLYLKIILQNYEKA